MRYNIYFKIFGTVWYHLHVDSEKDKLREIESKVVFTNACVWRKWGDNAQSVQTSSYKINIFSDLIYSMVMITNNIASHT